MSGARRLASGADRTGRGAVDIDTGNDAATVLCNRRLTPSGRRHDSGRHVVGASAASLVLLIGLFLGPAGCAERRDDTARRASALELQVPGDHSTIQGALDAAGSGDSVVVAAGQYTENVTLRSGVTLRGAGSQSTTLRGTVSFAGCTGCTVRGLKITASGASSLNPNIGIDVDGPSFTVSSSVVEGFEVGIRVNGTSNGELSASTIVGNQKGIEVSLSSNVRVFNNVVLNNIKAGILSGQGSSPSVVHNTVLGNGFAATTGEVGAGISIGASNQETVQNNIVVSNKVGLHVAEADANNHHNLVWGNQLNYSGAASAAASDITMDPMFMDATNQNFQLKSGSPAVDVGASAGVTTDLNGNQRPAGNGPDLGAFELQVSSGGDLVINEVLSNAVDEGKGEFVELYNPTGGPVDAAGLILDDGDATDQVVAFGGGSTVVPAGGYAVILDADYGGLSPPYDIPPEAILLTVTNAALGSGLSTNDPITISRDGAIVSTYLHPYNPGDGLSAERIDPNGPDVADNWATSPCGMSPGKQNCITGGNNPAGAATLIITEVMASPLDQGTGEFIEVYNYGSQSVELVGLKLTDGDATDTIAAVAGKTSLLPPGKLAVIIDSDLIPTMTGAPYNLNAEVPYVVTVENTTLGNGLTNSDPITILESDGTTVVATYSHPVTASGQSIERKDKDEADIASNWIPSPCPEKHSAGRENCASGSGGPAQAANLVITEVMSNAVDEDKDEFIEIHNPGDTPVNVAGLVITDGDATDQITAFPGAGGNTTIPAKGYGVILDQEYAGAYTIPAGAVLLSTEDTTLGNGLSTTDPITLYAADGLTELSSWKTPFNPGNGISAERKGTSNAINEWVASPCPTGSSPGGPNCAAEEQPSQSTVNIVISEVMSNPIDESRGEFIELVNLGTNPVDLKDYVISDGDTTDTIEGYQGGTTVVPAGGYAVILDRNYAELSPAPYSIPGAAILLTTDDSTIGSGLSNDDPIQLFAPDGTTVISTYSYPFNPGNGVSVERVDLADDDYAGNWLASPCPSGSSPGAKNCSDASGPQALQTKVIFSPQLYTESHITEIVNRLKQARRSIDVAIYSFSDASIKDELGKAVARGVKVRVIYESANEDDNDPAGTRSAALEDLGIDVRYINKIMHHKFTIIDGVQSPEDDPTKATLITGSGNFSFGAATNYDENTVFVKGNAELILRYQKEFNHIWRYSRDFIWNTALTFYETMEITDLQDTAASEAYFTSANFRTYRSDRYGNTFSTISGLNTVADKIVEFINGAQQSIYIASGHMRNYRIAEALMAKRQSAPGVDIKVYLDGQEYVGHSYHRQLVEDREECLAAAGDSLSAQQKCYDTGQYYGYDLNFAGVDVRFKFYAYRWNYSYAKQMHHKYFIFDNKTLITGSYNCSDNAEHNTIENVAVFHKPDFGSLVDEYIGNFNAIWETGAGLYAPLMNEVNTGDPIPLVFTPMALTYQEVFDLKQAIGTNCPAVFSDEYAQNPVQHQTCPRQ